MSKVVFPHDNSCLKKWRVKEGSSVIEGSVLCDFYKEKNCKLKCKFSGTVSKLLVKEGDTINSGSVKIYKLFLTISKTNEFRPFFN